MKLIQLNLNHCRAAHDLLHQTIREQQVDVAILSEQYKNKTTGAWISDLSGKELYGPADHSQYKCWRLNKPTTLCEQS